MFWGKVSRHKPKEKAEFSKLIYLRNLGVVAIVTGLSFLCVIMSGRWGISDLSPITMICTSAFTELGLHTVGYIHKAKCENVLKIADSIDKSKVSDKSLKIANQINNESEIIDTYAQG